MKKANGMKEKICVAYDSKAQRYCRNKGRIGTPFGINLCQRHAIEYADRILSEDENEKLVWAMGVKGLLSKELHFNSQPGEWKVGAPFTTGDISK